MQRNASHSETHFSVCFGRIRTPTPPAMTIALSGERLHLPQRQKPAKAGFEGMPPLGDKTHRRPLAVKARAGRLRTARLVLALTDKGRWCKISPAEGAYPGLRRFIPVTAFPLPVATPAGLTRRLQQSPLCRCPWSRWPNTQSDSHCCQ